jgi:aspartate/methionine/tyrosine aminotransferase
MFSRLVHDFSAPENDFARIRAEREANGFPILDLASANVNEADIFFPEDILRNALSQALLQTRMYRPDSKGQRTARAAIASYYGASTRASTNQPSKAADRIIITPGTSQSYLYLFRLLADTDGQILVPRPSYPLFDYIAKVAGVSLAYYDLEFRDSKWSINLASFAAAISPSIKCLVLVSPHNPTGHVLSHDEVHFISDITRLHQLPIIIDEVFCEFVFGKDANELAQRSGFSDTPLVFTLNGFSKMFALPGLKIGWIKVDGESLLVDRALASLETFADTFLATSELSQFAAPLIFDMGKPFLEHYRRRVLDRWKASAGLFTAPPEGGFYAIRSTGGRDEHEYALQLLERYGVLVHPGYFFGLPEGHIVFSFLKETTFDQW